MLSRRHFRIKVMQALYAFYVAGEDRLDVAERQLNRNFDKLHELYIYQLSLLVELAEMGRYRLEEAKKKFFPTADELNPNTRFFDNQIITALGNDPGLKKFLNKYKINWADEQESIRRLWVEIRSAQAYLSYIEKDTGSLDEDKAILKEVVRNHLASSDWLRNHFEERNIYWSDDYDTALMMVLKTIKAYHEGVAELLPDMMKDENVDEMKEFILPLFRKTILHGKEYETLITTHAMNWDYERIALVDVLLMKMAICELLQFPSIPVKVTINEYIEISKEYSTSKSKLFINGMLDKMVVVLRAENKLQKSGRGLLES